MAWHYLNEDLEPCTYSPEPEGESLRTLSGEEFPSALARLIPSQEEFFYNDNGTDYYRSSLFGMTLPPSTGENGRDGLILSPEDSRARTLVLRARERELKEIEAGYGAKWCESFAKLSPDGLSWRTPHFSLFEEFMLFCGTWPRWGIMLNGECWERTSAGGRTEGAESGLLPTPTASDAKRTPMKESYANRPTTEGCPDDLAKWAVRQSGLPHARLVPDLWEWAMGWPETWTELKPVGMDKFRSWLNRHGEY